MRKLLSANFSRLWKSKIFWLLESACFILNAIVYVLVAVNTKNLGQGWLEYNAHAYFYLPILFTAVLIAIFTCFYIGTDYSDGTMRNKLIVGHSRRNIYISYFLTTAAADMLFILAYLLAVFIIGLPLSGSAVVTCVEMQPWRILNILLFLLEYTALFVLLTITDSNKARNVLVCLLTAVVLILLGMIVYGRYSQPEFINSVVSLRDGGIKLQQGAPNHKYLTGATRTVFEWITLILPSGSVMLSLDKNLGFDWRIPIISALMALMLIWIGIRLFQKKDIR